MINKEIEQKIIAATKEELKYLAANEYARDFNLYSNPLLIDFFFMIFKVETLYTIDDYKTRFKILSFDKDGLKFNMPITTHENKMFFNSMQLIKNYTRLEI